MADTSIRIGLVGAGAIARDRHIPGFRAIAGVEIAGVANRSRASGEQVAGQFDIPHVYDTWEDVIADDSIDAVVIGTWPYLHCPVTLAALAAGKHVLTEGRMAMDLAQAEQMLAAARARPHLATQIAPGPFTLAVDGAIARRVAEGYLGDLLAVEIRAADFRPGGLFLDREAPITWRQDRAFSGLNTMTLGIWYECALRWTPGVSSVIARARTFVPMRREAQNGALRPASVPDHVAIVGDMPGGGTFQMTASGVEGLGPTSEVWLYGSEGTLRFQQAGGTLWGGRRGDSQLAEIEVPEGERGGWRVEAEFVNAIRSEEQVTRTSFVDGVRYMAFTQAVLESAATGTLRPVLH
ncbi:MAG: Gfo/Idh/MocA family protein [Dehalococcoidia bacterium]